jgi:hypothetical protein
MYTVLERNDGDLVVESPRDSCESQRADSSPRSSTATTSKSSVTSTAFTRPLERWSVTESGRVPRARLGRLDSGLQAFGLSRAASCDDPANVGRYETTLPEWVEVVAQEIADVTLGARVIHQIAYQRFGILPATLD